MSDQGKTNKNGRIDEHGALRHRLPEVCPVGAIVIHLFSYFHIEENPRPTFAPDFNHPGASALGYRDWYNLRLFPSSKSLYTEMSYESKFIFNHFIRKHSDANLERSSAANQSYESGQSDYLSKSDALWPYSCSREWF